MSKHVLNFATETNKFAPPKNHASSEKIYGEGNKNEYGHVKVDDEFDDESLNPVQNQVITQAINNLENNKADLNLIEDENNGINKQINDIETSLEEKASSSDLNDAQQDINDIKAILGTGGSNLVSDFLKLNTPKTTTSIDNLITPGFYIYHSEEEDSIKDLNNVYLNEALIFVLRNDTRTIQEIYPTIKIIHPTM